MAIDFQETQGYLKSFNFPKLFREVLGWETYEESVTVTVEDQTFLFVGIAHKRDFAILLHEGLIPSRAVRKKIDAKISRVHYEHLLIFVDPAKTTQVWQWVKHVAGKPIVFSDHIFKKDQSGNALIQKLDNLAFSIADEDTLSVVDVTRAVQAGFYKDRITKRFYDRFKTEHAVFLKFIQGIPDESLQRWYASVMLNRLMFVYFIQKKGFLDGDTNYLQSKLALYATSADDFYTDFLCPLFFQGFAQKDHPIDVVRKLGKIPYLNGGIFSRHQIEELHGETIVIPNQAFQKLFTFFEAYQWHLDERPNRSDDEINPDVLGYIFEKYVNQKQMGAYYTKEDITEYISKSTIIPHLFDTAKRECKIAFDLNGTTESPIAGSVWRLLMEDPDRYIYPAVKHGVVRADGTLVPETDLPDFVQTGMHDAQARMYDKRYNLQQAEAGDEIRLVTETWREYIHRRERCLDIRQKLANGELVAINDFITYNLDLRQFAQDLVENAEGPELLRAFWKGISTITVLDPTVGSGAFLFAALNILEPLYEACLNRMQGFVDELDESGLPHRPEKFSDFRKVLADVARHPNERYFVLKSIIVNNLFGVDIMDEAIEICKLRLFLKLVAQVESTEQIEPLPDIDFNIRAGNSLVGFTTLGQVQQAVMKTLSGQLKLVDNEDSKAVQRITHSADDIGRLTANFRKQQTDFGLDIPATDKAILKDRLSELHNELCLHLSRHYGVPPRGEVYARWVETHRPFHWFVEFHAIMNRGGFDVIIGNPPYVAASKIRDVYSVQSYQTANCTDIYAWVLERNTQLINNHGYSGMIVPLSISFSGDFDSCRKLLFSAYQQNWFSSFGRIPAALFSFDVRVRNVIHIGSKAGYEKQEYASRLHRWFDVARPVLIQSIEYAKFDPGVWGFLIPKINTSALGRALEKLLKAQNSTFGSYSYARTSKYPLSFKKTSYNWLTFCVDLPPCYKSEIAIPHTKFGSVYFLNEVDRNILLVLGNGLLMLCYWFILGDDFDLTRWNFEKFPISLKEIPVHQKEQLSSIHSDLMACMKESIQYKNNAGKKVGNYNLARCRDITLRSDLIFADYLGLSEVFDDFLLYYCQTVRTIFDDTPDEDAE